MRKTKYSVESRIKKIIFMAPYIVYDIVKKETRWHDPTHGNGGGDWYTFKKRVATFSCKEKAKQLYLKLEEEV